MSGLEGMKVDNIKPHSGSLGFSDGHGLLMLASGQLLNPS